MGINKKDLIELIIKPVLTDMEMYSKSAEQLVAGTIAQESNMGTYLKQVNGPAKGIAQMETATHDDIYKNYLVYRDDLKYRLFMSSNIRMNNENSRPSCNVLTFNLRYSVAMCRLAYYRQKEALPEADDVEGLARYWKKYYNTDEGKGTIVDFMHNWDRFLCGYYLMMSGL